MLFFNMKLLEELSCNNNQKLLTLLHHHLNKRTIPKAGEKIPPARVSLHGNSYLLNPEAFFRDKNTDILYRVQYLKLAAMRDFLLYKQYKFKALDTTFYPDLNWSGIKHNPLLIITPNQISFKYE